MLPLRNAASVCSRSNPESRQMIRWPFAAEWNTSRLPAERRAYLESRVTFEDVVARISEELDIIHGAIKPYDMPAPGEPRNARQVIFLVRVGDETCDLLYNASDGLRGRYWQSPDHGFKATRHLIDTLSP